MAVADDIQATASERRSIVIDALSQALDPTEQSSDACRLKNLLRIPVGRPMVVDGDIDGLLSAAMLASVTGRVGDETRWDVVALAVSEGNTRKLLVHPSVKTARPDNLFGLDVFSLDFDNVSNHVVSYGPHGLTVPAVRDAFDEWDTSVRSAASRHLLAVPSIWADTRAGTDEAKDPRGKKYKYPLGTAQILLALLEVAGCPPRFYDRQYLPLLIANCDGGVTSYVDHAYNVGIWWSILAGAVGPASLTEMVFAGVTRMRTLDLQDAYNRLVRETTSSGQPPLLNEKWSLANQTRDNLVQVVEWLAALTGWGDPIRDGVRNLADWTEVSPAQARVPLEKKYLEKDPAYYADLVRSAQHAINANFRLGGREQQISVQGAAGDPPKSAQLFNWYAGW